jgi:hypothetical protein
VRIRLQNLRRPPVLTQFSQKTASNQPLASRLNGEHHTPVWPARLGFYIPSLPLDTASDQDYILVPHYLYSVQSVTAHPHILQAP